MVQISGTVERVVYHKSSYYIVEVQDGYSLFTAKGNLFGVDRLMAGVPLAFEGRWVKSRKYGRQFQIQSWSIPAGLSVKEACRLLEALAGFDPLLGGTLAEHYGPDLFKALDKEAKVLADFPSEPDLPECLTRWHRTKAVQALSSTLRDGGLTSSDIEGAVLRFGSQAPKVISENPFRLMEIPGFSFTKADALALRLGFSQENPQRLEGAALWSLQEAGRNGHLYLKRGDIPTAAMDLKDGMGPLPLTDEPDRGFKDALVALESRAALIVDQGAGAYLPDVYKYERESAEMLSKLMTPSSLQVELAPFLEEFERSSQITLSEAQQDAVRQLIEHKVLVLTGLPGTGKTTAVKALVRLFEVSRTSFTLMAPTGIAAKRLSHVTGHPAFTVHRALGYDSTTWRHGPDNKYVTDAVIVDEVSMVDQELFFRLLSALRSDTLLVLVGDDAQLPSVGPGNVLRELVTCPDIPTVRLTQIFRQEAQSDIVLNSHRINNGETPTLGSPKGDSEFKFIPLSSEEKARELIVKIATKLKARDANFQVLAPKYEGAVGVDALNEALRAALNPPGPPEWQGKFRHFRLGDRVMVTKNNYQKGVYNGDAGKLIHIGSDQIILRIYGIGNSVDQEVGFTEREAEEFLRLAYAITVHRSQGSEFDTIIMPMFQNQGRMLQRNLIYTAVTRAKKQVWLLGQESAIQRAIGNNKVRQRNTVLAKAVSGVLRGSDET